MSKYQYGDYIQIPRDHFKMEKYTNLSNGAYRLLMWLKEYEHRYCEEEGDCFYRYDVDIAKDMNKSTRTIHDYREELKKAHIILCRLEPFESDDGRKSEKHRIEYYIVD